VRLANPGRAYRNVLFVGGQSGTVQRGSESDWVTQMEHSVGAVIHSSLRRDTLHVERVENLELCRTWDRPFQQNQAWFLPLAHIVLHEFQWQDERSLSRVNWNAGYCAL
jgi:hypothetical protein